MPEMERIESIEQAIDRLNLTGITVYALHAEQTDEAIAQGAPTGGDVDVVTQYRTAPDAVEYRCRMTVDTGARSLSVDAAIAYATDAPVEITPEVIGEYGTRVAIMAIYPYLRQSLTDLAMRLGFQLTLPVIKVGAITIESGPSK